MRRVFSNNQETCNADRVKRIAERAKRNFPLYKQIDQCTVPITILQGATSYNCNNSIVDTTCNKQVLYPYGLVRQYAYNKCEYLISTENCCCDE
jgi:hypothetical protein